MCLEVRWTRRNRRVECLRTCRGGQTLAPSHLSQVQLHFNNGIHCPLYAMDDSDDDTDLQLVKASATLLADLESALPKLLWRPNKSGTSHGRVHTQVRRRDLDLVIKLVRVTRPDHCRHVLTVGDRSSRSKASRNYSMPG